MIYSSWDMEHKILKLVVLGHFLSFYSLKNSKNQNFEKLKNLLETLSFCTCVPKVKITCVWFLNTLKILSFYKCVPKKNVIWCMVSEIWSATDKIFCYIRPFFTLLTPTLPSNNSKKQNFEKMIKKTLETLLFYTATL